MAKRRPLVESAGVTLSMKPYATGSPSSRTSTSAPGRNGHGTFVLNRAPKDPAAASIERVTVISSKPR
jgi:hypothetical protein